MRKGGLFVSNHPSEERESAGCVRIPRGNALQVPSARVVPCKCFVEPLFARWIILVERQAFFRRNLFGDVPRYFQRGRHARFYRSPCSKITDIALLFFEQIPEHTSLREHHKVTFVGVANENADIKSSRS